MKLVGNFRNATCLGVAAGLDIKHESLTSKLILISKVFKAKWFSFGLEVLICGIFVAPQTTLPP